LPLESKISLPIIFEIIAINKLGLIFKEANYTVFFNFQ
jgi:hypothetical protein